MEEEQHTKYSKKYYHVSSGKHLYQLIDFEKAFDSLHRDTLWKMMDFYGIPTKLTTILKSYMRTAWDKDQSWKDKDHANECKYTQAMKN